MEATTFDLETMKLAQDLDGGWAALRRGEGGVSCLVLWSARTGRPHLFDANTLSESISMLEASDVVLSFNGVGFDVPVLEGVSGKGIHLKEHLDLLQLIWEAIGKQKGYTLDECGQRTLGWGKNGHGEMAPQLAEDGRWTELLEYCLGDVVLTLELFTYAQKNGGIIGIDGELLRLPLPEWFSQVKLR